MSNRKATASPDRRFDLKVGPLCYRFEAGDPWGARHLQAISSHLCNRAAASVPDRIVRLCRAPHPPRSGASLQSCSPLGRLEEAVGSPDVFWSETASADLPPFRYQLPWSLIIADIARLGGAVIHAGLATRNGRALLFLAPPGGGKSSTLATAPAGWQVLSDDAALIWPHHDLWRASPLPSWTMMTATDPGRPGDKRFNPGKQCACSGLVVLVKAAAISLEQLAPAVAARHLYRALSEYPSTVMTALPLTEHFFRTACSLARALPCWRLELPLDGNIWPGLEALLGEVP